MDRHHHPLVDCAADSLELSVDRIALRTCAGDNRKRRQRSDESIFDYGSATLMSDEPRNDCLHGSAPLRPEINHALPLC